MLLVEIDGVAIPVSESEGAALATEIVQSTPEIGRPCCGGSWVGFNCPDCQYVDPPPKLYGREVVITARPATSGLVPLVEGLVAAGAEVHLRDCN